MLLPRSEHTYAQGAKAWHPFLLWHTGSVVVGRTAQELLPGAFLMGCGGVGCTVEAAFVEVDEPDLTGWADDEVAQVCVAEAYAEVQQRLPEFVDLLPQSIAYG